MTEPSVVNYKSLLSRIEELRNFDENLKLHPEQESFLNDQEDEIESNINQICQDSSGSLNVITNDDLDKSLQDLKNELRELQCENLKVENDVEELSARCLDDYDKLENELEKMTSLSELIVSKDQEKANADMQIYGCCIATDSKFEMLELNHLIEKKNTTLKSMQELDHILKRFEAIEKVEDASTGLSVIEVEENLVRLSLNTNIPFLEHVLHRQDIENPADSLEVNHKLMIEVVDGTLELKKVEIFPNDVFIGEIIDAAKDFPKLSPLYQRVSSSLEWFVRRVHDRIVLSSLRRFVVKNAKNSRHTYEYLEREDVVVAHIASGVNASIKLPQGWPISELALELISLNSTSQNSQKNSLSFLHKTVETTNSLDPHVRQNLSYFTDSIEEIINLHSSIPSSS